jgi:hypothetical protein
MVELAGVGVGLSLLIIGGLAVLLLVLVAVQMLSSED